MLGLTTQYKIPYMTTTTHLQDIKFATIIIVDDEIPIAHMIGDILTDEGYAVEIYHNGESALQAILARPPGLVLLDVAMPVMTGEELLVTLRKTGFRSLPIIMMSAGPRLHNCAEQGASAIIAKPFELPYFLECVEKYYFDGRNLGQALQP